MTESKKTTAKKTDEPLRDSEGLRVVSAKDETEVVDDNAGAREAFEAEVAKDAAEEEAKKQAEFEKFLAER